MTPGAWWIVAGLLGCAAEMVVPGAFLLPIGLAACGTGIITAVAGLGWTGQFAAFAALTSALVGAAAIRLRHRRQAPDALNAPGADLIGQTCRALEFEGAEGRVSLRDGTWPARMTDRPSPASGEALRVVGLDGTTLLVARPAG